MNERQKASMLHSTAANEILEQYVKGGWGEMQNSMMKRGKNVCRSEGEVREKNDSMG